MSASKKQGENSSTDRGRARKTAEQQRDDAQQSRDRFAFLAEASRCLADSLDYETTLTTIAGMALPYLGAWCIVDVVNDDGAIRRLAVLHPDPTKQRVARELHIQYPPNPSDTIGVPRVVRTGRPEMVFDVSDEALKAMARDTKHLQLLRDLGTEAYVIVPMVARGRTLGAMTFVTADTARRFGDIDVVMAEDLARRAAMAIDNARLYRDAETARRIADEANEEAQAASEKAEAAAEEERFARDAAEEALKARDEFVAMVSHEVRTPLNAIVGYTQLLELELAGELTAMQRSYVERLRDSSRHLLRLVDDVLDLSKTDAGRLTVARDAVAAADTARAALAVVRPQAVVKLVALTDACDHDSDLHYLGDEHRVRQVLINLLGNAIKFTRPGGHVTLECALHDDGTATRGAGRWIEFRVRDTGPGVPAEKAEVIFEPFEQGQAGLTRPGGGSGLGLAISRRLARLMGGNVTLKRPSGQHEVGAEFTLRLPAAQPAPILAAEGRLAGATSPPETAAARSVESLSLGVPHGTAGQRDAARRGLSAASWALLREIGPATEEIVARVRADDRLNVSDAMTDVEVADHIGTLLTDVANSLAVLGESGGEPTELLVDGSKIQRLIGELHGAQRCRLGWTEEQLLREMDIVRDVSAAAVRRAIGDDLRAGEPAAIALSRLMDERRRACLSGYRRAVP